MTNAKPSAEPVNAPQVGGDVRKMAQKLVLDNTVTLHGIDRAEVLFDNLVQATAEALAAERGQAPQVGGDVMVIAQDVCSDILGLMKRDKESGGFSGLDMTRLIAKAVATERVHAEAMRSALERIKKGEEIDGYHFAQGLQRIAEQALDAPTGEKHDKQ